MLPRTFCAVPMELLAHRPAVRWEICIMHQWEWHEVGQTLSVQTELFGSASECVTYKCTGPQSCVQHARHSTDALYKRPHAQQQI